MHSARHVIERILYHRFLNHARHVIERILYPRFLNQMASYDVASTILQSPTGGGDCGGGGEGEGGTGRTQGGVICPL